jgi:hypothetical protein
MEQLATQRIQSPRVLKPMENGVGVRERPRTMLSPELKRVKTIPRDLPSIVVLYPETVPIPSKRVIEALYKASDEEGFEGSNDRISDEKKHYNDQQRLTPAGVLSFEDVVLPAIGLEEEKAIKRVQSKVQRDAPEYKFLMENCRRLVRESIRSAMHEVVSSRSIRERHQEERKRQQILERKRAFEAKQRARQEEQERAAKELARQKEVSRAEKRRYLTREHPRNQDLWKEIVLLTSSVAQLEREQRMWIQIEEEMMRLENEQDIQKGKESPDAESESAPAILVEARINPLQIKNEEKVKDMILTSTRIQKGLEMILELFTESEKIRKELHDNYKKDHVFSGYQSVRKPKNLIRFLSQSQ